MNKKILVAGIAMSLGFFCTAEVAANETRPEYALDEVIVLGNRPDRISIGQTPKVMADGYTHSGVSMGYLGMTDTMKAPFTGKSNS